MESLTDKAMCVYIYIHNKGELLTETLFMLKSLFFFFHGVTVVHIP